MKILTKMLSYVVNIILYYEVFSMKNGGGYILSCNYVYISIYFSPSLSLYIYIYTYKYICLCVYWYWMIIANVCIFQSSSLCGSLCWSKWGARLQSNEWKFDAQLLPLWAENSMASNPSSAWLCREASWLSFNMSSAKKKHAFLRVFQNHEKKTSKIQRFNMILNPCWIGQSGGFGHWGPFVFASDDGLQ